MFAKCPNSKSKSQKDSEDTTSLSFFFWEEARSIAESVFGKIGEDSFTVGGIRE